MANQGMILDKIILIIVLVNILELLLAFKPQLKHLANGVTEADKIVVDHSLTVEVLLAQDTDQCQKLVHLPQVEYRVVVQLYETRTAAVKGGFLRAVKTLSVHGHIFV